MYESTESEKEKTYSYLYIYLKSMNDSCCVIELTNEGFIKDKDHNCVMGLKYINNKYIDGFDTFSENIHVKNLYHKDFNNKFKHIQSFETEASSQLTINYFLIIKKRIYFQPLPDIAEEMTVIPFDSISHFCIKKYKKENCDRHGYRL